MGEVMRGMVAGALALVMVGCTESGAERAQTTVKPTVARRPPPETRPVVLSPAEVRAVQAAARRKLKDPESARFGAIAASETASGGRFFCGTVNARNGFGGYTGSTPFTGILVTGPTPIALVSQFGQSERDARIVIGICEGLGVI